MTIKLIKAACNRSAGSVIEVNDDHGAILLSKGYGVVEVRTKSVASADTKGKTLADVSRDLKKRTNA